MRPDRGIVFGKCERGKDGKLIGRMGKYIDIHNHILPGTDDGAKNAEESLEMLRQAARQGVGSLILTPHQKPDRHCVSVAGAAERTARLQEAADREGIPVKLYSGGEVLYSLDMLERLERGKAGTLAGSAYVLTEFLPGEEWNYIYNGLDELTAAGYIPVVAHPERYLNVVSDFNRVEELKDLGCLIQVNASDLPGFAAAPVKRAARRLIRDELADFVATDAHRESGGRSFQLEECAAWLKRKCSPEYAEKLLYGNAAGILKEKQI